MTESTELPPDLIENDFVYCGRRLVRDEKMGYAIRLLLEGVCFSEERLFLYSPKPHARFVVGGVYTGAKFNATQALGVDRAKYVKLLELSDVMLWEAKDEEAVIEMKTLKLEADDKRRGMIESNMLSLRMHYQKLIAYSDIAAFEAAVLRALRKPIGRSKK